MLIYNNTVIESLSKMCFYLQVTINTNLYYRVAACLLHNKSHPMFQQLNAFNVKQQEETFCMLTYYSRVYKESYVISAPDRKRITV